MTHSGQSKPERLRIKGRIITIMPFERFAKRHPAVRSRMKTENPVVVEIQYPYGCLSYGLWTIGLDGIDDPIQ